MRTTTVLLTALAAVLAASPALARGRDDRPARPSDLRGEVVAIRQTTATADEGSFTEVRVRTREEQQTWLRLGPADEMEGAFRVGDRVRARVLAAEGDGPRAVTRIRNERTGKTHALRDDRGRLLRRQDRDRSRDRDRDRDRDRTRTPGPGGAGPRGPGHGGSGPGGSGHGGPHR